MFHAEGFDPVTRCSRKRSWHNLWCHEPLVRIVGVLTPSEMQQSRTEIRSVTDRAIFLGFVKETNIKKTDTFPQVTSDTQFVTDVQLTLLLSSSTKNCTAVLRRESISKLITLKSDFLSQEVRKCQHREWVISLYAY